MIKRYRKIKKYGNSFVITLSLVDMKDLELKEGQEVDISDITPKQEENNENGKQHTDRWKDINREHRSNRNAKDNRN